MPARGLFVDEGGPWERVPTARRRIVIHWEHGGRAFCGTRGAPTLAADEARVTCKRCLHKIGIQDST